MTTKFKNNKLTIHDTKTCCPIKYLLILFLLISFTNLPGIAQITNVKAGFWSDNSIWSSKVIPGYADAIVLNFDVIVDINGSCKTLTLNGHNVTVNPGVTLNIVGVNSIVNIDTTVVFTKKTFFHNNQANQIDSSIQIFRNNKINGSKGYIVKERYNQTTPTTSIFKYNSLGQLNEIATTEDTQLSAALSTVNLTWDENKIVHIKWDNLGSYGMDRYYNYEVLNDTLLIQYTQNIGRDLYLDSATVTLSTDLGLNKIFGITKGGEFDYTNIFFNAKGVFYNERKFHYLGNNIESVKYYGETYYNTTPYSYSFEADSSLCYFNRQPLVNTFLSDIEKDIFGKEYKLLCYDQTDSVNLILDSYFNTGSWSTGVNLGDPMQDYFQSESVLNNSQDPIIESKINYAVRRDKLITEQQSGYLYKKLAYVLDSSKRVVVIKEYDAFTNALITEFQFIYP
jgi:hypothetical protein